MALLAPVQKGRSLIVGNVPTFAEVVVQVGTWAEHEITPQGVFESQEGIENISTSDKTRIEVSPTWCTITGQTPLVKGAVIVETTGATRKWVVTDITSTWEADGKIMNTGTWVYDETLAGLIS